MRIELPLRNGVVAKDGTSLIALFGTEIRLVESEVLTKSCSLHYQRAEAGACICTIQATLPRRMGELLDTLNQLESRSYETLVSEGRVTAAGQSMIQLIKDSFAWAGSVRLCNFLALPLQPFSSETLACVFSGESVLLLPVAPGDPEILARMFCCSENFDRYLLIKRTLEQFHIESNDDLRISSQFAQDIRRLLNRRITLASGQIGTWHIPTGRFEVFPIEMSSHDNLEALVHPLLGPVRFCEPIADRSEGVHSFWAQHSAPSAQIHHANMVRGVGIGGMHWNKEQARKRTIGEAWERYCGCHPPRHETISLSTVELVERTPSFEQLPLYSERQYLQSGFPYHPITTLQSIDATVCENLTRKREEFLPIEFIWVTDANRIVQSTSSGMATHQTTERATLKGLFELIERDYFLRVWHRAERMRSFAIESLPPTIRTAILQLPRHLMVRCLCEESDLVPGVFVVIASLRHRERDGAPSCIVGSGCDSDIVAAMESAVFEMLRGYDYFRIAYPSHALPLASLAAVPPTPSGHVRWHWQPGRMSRSDFLFHSNLSSFPTIHIEQCHSDSEWIARIVSNLSVSGHDVWRKEISNRNGAPPVIRMVSSMLTPLYFGPALFRRSSRLTFEGLLPWNPAPHPLP